MRGRVLAVVMVGVVLAGAFAVSSPASGTTDAEIAAALFKKINNKRVKAHSLSSAEEWNVIVQEATDHSAYQLRQGRISHDGFNGRAARIRSAGSGLNGVCENVGFVSGVTDLKTIVRTLYRGWDRSPGHHDCMFDADFHTTWAGVGVVHSGSTWYATYIAAQDASPASP
jgi:uncharacterized protein YkwD